MVSAHRYYQFAMCMYKVWRYKDGEDLLEKVSNKQKINQSLNKNKKTTLAHMMENETTDSEMHEHLLGDQRGIMQDSPTQQRPNF